MDKSKFNRLIHRFKDDIGSFNKIYEYYFPRIKIYIDRKYYDYDFGEDVAQEFFIKLFKANIPDDIEYPTLWVFEACDNIAKTYLMTAKNKRHAPLAEDYAAAADLDDEYCHLKNGGISEENIAVLKKLDKETLEILVMYFWEGYNYKEIALKLGISHDLVRQKASRGLKKLKNFMINCHTLTFIISLLR